MANRGLTGVLLVGGASERFGSPKALARFRGETLAERAWRVLSDACDEVVAVGKVADRLSLPFPLVDDGTASRAPIYGVIAGLRAARHDVCVFLPVDCPLIDAATVRALGEGVGIPHTGPLPGAYARAMLPQLEERVTRGELSLRGVNPVVLVVSERLTADVDTPEDLERITATLQ